MGQCMHHPHSPNDEIQKNIITSIAEFALKFNNLLYQQSQKQENVLFSPISLYSTLALIQLGSNGKTSAEVAELLGFFKQKIHNQHYHLTLKKILEDIKNTTKVSIFEPKSGQRKVQMTDINIVEGIFVPKEAQLKSSYISKARFYYKGKVSNLNFTKESNNATNEINEYISTNTKGRIPQLYSKPLKPETGMIITCTQYIKATWEHPFSKSTTYDDIFNTGLETIVVKMMSKTINTPYIDIPSLKAEAIEIKYSGYDISMFIILPNVDQTLDNLIQSLRVDDLTQIVQNSKENYVNYVLPKMKFKWSENVEKHLQSFGVQQMFTNKPKLKYMFKKTQSHVSEITHVTEIETDEKGIDACAPSGIKLKSETRGEIISQPLTFIVNRAFVFFIRHNATNTILLLGSVKNPNGNQHPS